MKFDYRGLIEKGLAIAVTEENNPYKNKVMAQYIDKSALAAEIKKRIKGLKDCHADTVEGYAGEISGLKRLLSFLDTLEAKEVENTELLKVKGYLVRDKDDYTAIYAEKPHRGKTEWVNGNGSCLMTINDARLVPDIEFEDEPVEVEVTLKRV